MVQPTNVTDALPMAGAAGLKRSNPNLGMQTL